jgi:hypothetical protein
VTTFVDVHRGFYGVTRAQLRELQERALAVEAREGVRFPHNWLDAEQGILLCLSSAPSREALLRAHALAEHLPSDVYEVTAERPHRGTSATRWGE